MESAIGLCKTELIDLETTRRWTGRNEVKRETADWVKCFNDERLHSAIEYRPPSSMRGCTVPTRRPNLGPPDSARPSDGARAIQPNQTLPPAIRIHRDLDRLLRAAPDPRRTSRNTR
ncbi:hypothetical protein GCM10009832_32710 [Dietzia kunjamensis subsp. schimae]|nr:transposase [Dietzia kunjamensis subsp. schimae]